METRGFRVGDWFKSINHEGHYGSRRKNLQELRELTGFPPQRRLMKRYLPLGATLGAHS